MNTDSYTILGSDFARAGYASSKLKELLKKIGVEPVLVRRAVIAAYEAETNVVIHARKGTMQVALNTGQIDVEVTDEGPGIPDIELAMQDGFSTAPAAARELGFGAGMGLPNIKRNTDKFEIQSTLGHGTRVAFTIYLKPQDAAAPARNSIRILPDTCCECLSCLRACPTGALRARDGIPMILNHLCIDCAACIKACEAGALTVTAPSDMRRPPAGTVLVIPEAFLVQFGAGTNAHEVLSALTEFGFANVRVAEEWSDALRDAVLTFAEEPGRVQPVISPACPATVNLIEMRFPSLIPNIAPFLSPIEAAHHELRGQNVAFVIACPAQCSVLTSKRLTPNVAVAGPSRLQHDLLRIISGKKPRAKDDQPIRSSGKEDVQGVLRVNGIRHVMRALDEVENGLLDDVRVMELFACDQGCFGSPLWSEDPFVTSHRWLRSGASFRTQANAVRQNAGFRARAGLRLDTDMSRAIKKLSKIQEIARRLPGKNCAMCGAPTCTAFAEDVVMERAPLTACRYRTKNQGETL